MSDPQAAAIERCIVRAAAGLCSDHDGPCQFCLANGKRAVDALLASDDVLIARGGKPAPFPYQPLDVRRVWWVFPSSEEKRA